MLLQETKYLYGAEAEALGYTTAEVRGTLNIWMRDQDCEYCEDWKETNAGTIKLGDKGPVYVSTGSTVGS